MIRGEYVVSIRIAIKITTLTFCITWGLTGILLIANQFGHLEFGTTFSMVIFLIGVCAPAIAAFVILPKNNVILFQKQNTAKSEQK